MLSYRLKCPPRVWALRVGLTQSKSRSKGRGRELVGTEMVGPRGACLADKDPFSGSSHIPKGLLATSLLEGNVSFLFSTSPS